MVAAKRLHGTLGASGVAGPFSLFKFAGAKFKKKASDDSSSGGPSGSSAPANGNPNPNPNPIPPGGPDGHPCPVQGCGRSFTTKTGLGVHIRRAHPDYRDAQIKPGVMKAVWSQEEILRLARKEAALTLAGVRFINQHLLESFPERTLESIKGRRKRADYKQLVADAVQRLSQEAAIDNAAAIPEDIVTDDEAVTATLLRNLQDLPVPQGRGYHIRTLLDICARAGGDPSDIIISDVSNYIYDAILPGSITKASRGSGVPLRRVAALSKRQIRRAEYAKAQESFRRCPGSYIRDLLDGLSGADQLSKEVMQPFWTATFTGIHQLEDGLQIPLLAETPCNDLWVPIQLEEIQLCFPKPTTAMGPDNLSARRLRSIPIEILVRIFNIILICRRLPEHLLLSRTIFIPKKSVVEGPGDFRPITISSVITRCLHKILAKRLSTSIPIDSRQKAFIRIDGCAEATFQLDLVLRYHHTKLKNLYIASIDISKAFDAVSHQAIIKTLQSRGVPKPMIDYIENVYLYSKTILCGPHWKTPPIHPTRGVKQGDPLSPVLFNLIIDSLLRSLPQHIGVDVDGFKINALAYADDLLLFATTRGGLQELMDSTVEFMGARGLAINATKSFVIALNADGKNKKIAVNPKIDIYCDGRRLPALKRSDTFRYLGVDFTPEGRTAYFPQEVVGGELQLLSAAPLKPQQRLWALRSVLLPRIFHRSILGRITIGSLNKVDKLVRHHVRHWLHLPHDVPIAYFHAAVRDGGLGVSSMRWLMPALRLGRLTRLYQAVPEPNTTPGSYYSSELQACRRRLVHTEGTIVGSVDIRTMWSQRLYKSVDGAALIDSGKVPQQHSWLLSPRLLLSGRDFINCCRIRINALPSASRTSRGRTADRRCRGGCGTIETTNHILQVCHRTHRERIRRHDAIVHYIQRTLSRAGFSVQLEPRYQTNDGLRKPDIVATMGRTALIIDAQVVSESACTRRAHRKKTDYYGKNEDLIRQIKRDTCASEVYTHSATLTWRGVWNATSVNELLNIGAIKKPDIAIISTRVLIGGIAAFRIFNATTSMLHWRRGVG